MKIILPSDIFIGNINRIIDNLHAILDTHIGCTCTIDNVGVDETVYELTIVEGPSPCPVCKCSGEELRVGREPLYDRLTYRYFIECSCGVRGPDADNSEEATAKWNRMPR